MTIGTSWSVCPVDATFSAYAAHDSQQQDLWRTRYEEAADAARQAAFYQAAQAVIIAGIQAAAADHAADQQWNIANRQMTIAEEEYERYKEHFICVEHELADDACEDQLYTPDYETRPNRTVVDVRRQFSQARKRLERQRSRYCLNDFGRAMCDLEAKEARATAAGKDAGYRYEESQQIMFDDRRFNRRIQVSNLGRNIQAQQVQTYASAMGMANAAIATRLSGINNFLGAVSGGISGMIQANLATQISPSPFTNAYAGATSPYNFHTGTGSHFQYGGPTPLGSAAAGVNGGIY